MYPVFARITFCLRRQVHHLLHMGQITLQQMPFWTLESARQADHKL